MYTWQHQCLHGKKNQKKSVHTRTEFLALSYIYLKVTGRELNYLPQHEDSI